MNQATIAYTTIVILGGGAGYSLATGTAQALVLWAILVCCVVALAKGVTDVYETYQAGKKNSCNGKKKKGEDLEMGRSSTN